VRRGLPEESNFICGDSESEQVTTRIKRFGIITADPQASETAIALDKLIAILKEECGFCAG
jgi:hypothetical protein